MNFEIGCELECWVKEPSVLVFNIQAVQTGGQSILEEQLTITPDKARDAYKMPQTGNRCFRFEAGHGLVQVSYRAVVAHQPLRSSAADIMEVPIARLPPDVLPYLYPSRFCQADRIAQLASAEFGSLDRGHDRVTGICNWIYWHLNYEAGASDAHTSALDSLIDRAGVCRDYAHLGIALCRALGIPARYVSAYAWRLYPPDFHAVFEAFLDGRWYLFDPTRRAAIEGLVRVGVGRDAAEVAFADFTGAVDLGDIAVRIDARDASGPYTPTTDAVSLSAA